MPFFRSFPCAVLSVVLAALPATAQADAAELRSRHSQLREQLQQNTYGQPLHIDSSEQQDRLTGDVYAVLDHPFQKVSLALRDPVHWCDILILPFNTKYCHAVRTEAGPSLQVRIGRKFDQPVDQAYKLQFSWRNVAQQAEYFETRLQAKDGPVGTRDYRINVSAVPLDGNRTFLRLNYSYGFGMAGRMAMQVYLGTVGADKVGFTVVGRDGAGQPQYIDGVRGAVERNAMRYYLAIDAFLDTMAAPADQRVERRIRNWFAATERYPRQLREMDLGTYATMKRQEVVRQQTLLE
jgi:hypothetical protein